MDNAANINSPPIFKYKQNRCWLIVIWPLLILTFILCIFPLVPVNALTEKDVVKNYDFCANNYSSVVFENNLFFAIGWDGRIKTSSDGKSWSICETGITDSISDVEWNGKYYVAVGYETILVSQDGFHWECRGNTSFFFEDIVWDGNKFIATGGELVGCSISAGIVASSDDGINWSIIDVDFNEKDSLETFGYNIFIRDENYYLLGTGFTSMGEDGLEVRFVLSSKDGLNWKQADNTNIYNDNYNIARSNSLSVKYKWGANEIFVSSDQETWVKKTLPKKYNLYSIAYGNNTFVLLDGYGRLLTSENAENWYESEKKNSGINSIVFTGNKFIAVGDDGRILISNDGINWIIVELDEKYYLENVIYKNGLYVAVGFVYKNESIYSGLISTSTDGINWASKELATQNTFCKVLFENEQFKVYSGGDYKVNDVLEYTSDNGYNWRSIRQKNKDYIFKTVTNGNNYLALTGDESSEGGLLISKDGVKWDRLYIRMYYPESLNLVDYNDVLWNGNQYIVVGHYQEDEGQTTEGIILSSKDGYNWQCLEGFTQNAIDCVAAGLDRTIAISSEGLLLTIINNPKEDNSTQVDGKYIETYTEPYNYSKSSDKKNINPAKKPLTKTIASDPRQLEKPEPSKTESVMVNKPDSEKLPQNVSAEVFHTEKENNSSVVHLIGIAMGTFVISVTIAIVSLRKRKVSLR